VAAALAVWPAAAAVSPPHSAMAGHTVRSVQSVAPCRRRYRSDSRHPCSEQATQAPPPGRHQPCSTALARCSSRRCLQPPSTVSRRTRCSPASLCHRSAACPSGKRPCGMPQWPATTSPRTQASTAAETRLGGCKACRRNTAPRDPRGPRRIRTVLPAVLAVAKAGRSHPASGAQGLRPSPQRAPRAARRPYVGGERRQAARLGPPLLPQGGPARPREERYARGTGGCNRG
jgi:hypothetical protein